MTFIATDWRSNQDQCAAVVCSKCGMTNQLVFRDGDFFCRRELGCELRAMNGTHRRRLF